MMASFEQYDAEHDRMWKSMRIIRDAGTLDRMAKTILPHREVYEAVARRVSATFPWQLVAVIHIREAGLVDVGRWACTLHNGEKIIGTGKKTTIVPKGLGPFDDFISAAVHALKLKGFDKIAGVWTPGKMLSAAEPYNGYGYRNGPKIRGTNETHPPMPSPYLWASTNHQVRGKYTRDHYFDPDVMDSQVGVAALLKYLGVGEAVVTPTEVGTAAGTTGTVVAVGIQQGWDVGHIVMVAVAVAITTVILTQIVRVARRKQ